MYIANRSADIKEKLKLYLNVPVVAVPVYNAFEDFFTCLATIDKFTPLNIPVLIVDDGSTDPEIEALLNDKSFTDRVFYIKKKVNSGFVSTCNLIFALADHLDVVLVNSDVIVPENWLSRLQRAAYSRTNVATATPLTNNGTILSVPYRNTPVPNLVGGYTLAEIDRKTEQISQRQYPIIPTAIGHCTYFKRIALDKVGFFDDVFAPGYGEEVDFSQRAVAVGFCHVAADDLFVLHHGSRSFDSQGVSWRKQVMQNHDQILAARYPWYHPWVWDTISDRTSPLAEVLDRLQFAMLPLKIGLDVTYVNSQRNGTHVLALELLRALSAAKDSSTTITAIISDNIDRQTKSYIARYADAVVTLDDLRSQQQPIFDLVHRPAQAQHREDVALLRLIGRRVVISQLDCIAYGNPAYADDPQAWLAYRRTTQYAFQVADGVMFISHDAVNDAHQHGLCTAKDRRYVSYVGVDHEMFSGTQEQPSQLPQNRPFLVVLGTNFAHKNRPFAIQVLQALREKYKWQGTLVFAGSAVNGGGSMTDEQTLLRRYPEIRPFVLDVGPVTDSVRSWLLARAALVLYPSIYEGFGLIPFEAAKLGTPTLALRSTSLSEVLGDEMLFIETLHPQNAADTVWRLLDNPAEAQYQVDAIQSKAKQYTWALVANQTWDFYQRILNLPVKTNFSITQNDQTILQQPEAIFASVQHSKQKRRIPRFVWWAKRLRRLYHLQRGFGWIAVRERIRQYIIWRLKHHR